ncbi:MAG: tetratricopeptide repeat protein [Gammaproteobacteria bacterium]|nr:tetratricopeptide repeat protein [Gammaproteobacteria bacterium]
MEDRYGLELTTSSAAARDAYIEGVDRILAANPYVEEQLTAAIEADPAFALPHAALARQHQLCARSKEARAEAEIASQLVEGASERERQHVEVFAKMVTGKIPDALALTRAHLKDYPRDAFVLAPSCGVFGLIGFSGRVDREPEQLELLEPLVDAYGDDWWFLTAHAFALIEMGEWEQGRILVERSLEQMPRNPHGAHIRAHALYEAGDDGEALRYLREWLPGYDREGLLHCHIWWHCALLNMTLGNNEEAWRAYDENCAPGASTSPTINILTDGASLLWRSELAGQPRQPARWEAMREYYEGQFPRPMVFVDAHAGLAYAALGQDEALSAYIEQVQELGEGGRLPGGTIGASMSSAFGAFAAGRWSEVIDTLEAVMGDVVRIGGSRAQRDLATNTLLAAYVKDGRPAEAQAYLDSIEDRQPTRPIAGLI